MPSAQKQIHTMLWTKGSLGITLDKVVREGVSEEDRRASHSGEKGCGEQEKQTIKCS